MDSTDQNTDPTAELFNYGQTVAAIRLTNYLDWACSPEKYSYYLALPPIQRGSVWNPRQIANLWDSLLRQMPIGSLMLTKLEEKDYCAPISNPSERLMGILAKSGFNLLDGQQRTLAMLLGWPDACDTDRRIWIDLGEDGKNGSIFLLRITTQSQPFGFQPGSHDKLSKNDRQRARERFNEACPELTHIESYELPLDKTKPWKNDESSQNLLLPLREAWATLKKSNSDISTWSAAIISNYLPDAIIDVNSMNRLIAFGNALLQIENAWVALQYVPDLHNKENTIEKSDQDSNPSHDPLLMLFERISTGGSRLRPEDLLFSIIKQAYPQSHNLVQRIHSLSVVGHLMTATDYIMTAVRIACALAKADPAVSERIHKLEDQANPNAKHFHTYLKGNDLLGTDEKPGPLRKLIDTPNTGAENSLVTAFQILNELITYRLTNIDINVTADIGLPRVLIPYLSRPLLQIYLLWLVRIIESGNVSQGILDDSRNELIKFALFWLLCNKGADSEYKASKRAYQILQNRPVKVRFPAFELYAGITTPTSDEDALFHRLVSPDDIDQTLEIVPSPVLRDMKRRYKAQLTTAEFEATSLFDKFWDSNNLLLWLQRHWVAAEFKGYNPLAGRDDKDNVPYDFDHLVPQAHWYDGRSIRTIDGIREDVAESFNKSWHRHSIGNSIGNYRIEEGSQNRSDSDMSLYDKLQLSQNFQTNWTDYVFDPTPQELGWWRTASPTVTSGEDHWEFNRKWDEKRIEAFQSAVEHRALYLYRKYFFDAGFDVWLNHMSTIHIFDKENRDFPSESRLESDALKPITPQEDWRITKIVEYIGWRAGEKEAIVIDRNGFIFQGSLPHSIVPFDFIELCEDIDVNVLEQAQLSENDLAGFCNLINSYRIAKLPPCTHVHETVMDGTITHLILDLGEETIKWSRRIEWQPNVSSLKLVEDLMDNYAARAFKH